MIVGEGVRYEAHQGAPGGEPGSVFGSEEEHGGIPTPRLGAGAALQEHRSPSR